MTYKLLLNGTVLSLFDYSGQWSRPYRENGYHVIQIDLKLGTNVMDIDADWLTKHGPIDIILAAPPCTDFAVSGARWFKEKDADGRTVKSLELISKILEIVRMASPRIWALENPVGRLPRLLPEIGKPWYWQPFWFGDPYTKKTGLWGKFSIPDITNVVDPIKVCKQGSWIQKLGGKSERTKELRSITPLGFAYAFYEVNK